MNTINKIINRLENLNIQVSEYKENNKLCGYELNTYTDAGVNMIVFVDFRNAGMNPKNAKHFIHLFNERVNSVDIEEEIGYLRQDKYYMQQIGTELGYQDLKNWKEDLQNIFSTKTPEQRQFEQTVDKFRSSIAELEKIVELMPTKGNSSNDCQKINILNNINELHQSVNGIELEDFTPNEYSNNFKLSYS